MEKIELQALPRTITGRATKSLRSSEILPGVIYGHSFTSINIQIPLKAFQKAYTQAGESTLLYVRLGDESYPTIIHDVAIDPVSDRPIPAPFY